MRGRRGLCRTERIPGQKSACENVVLVHDGASKISGRNQVESDRDRFIVLVKGG